MKILVFGTGKFYRKRKGLLGQLDILALLDNDESKQGTKIDGHPVISPAKISELVYDGIILCSQYEQEMRDQLSSLGVPVHKVFPFEMWRKFMSAAPRLEIKRIFTSSNNLETRCTHGRVALISTELNYTGAAAALVPVSESLISHGYSVCVFAVDDGVLRDEYLKIGAEVRLAPWLREVYLDDYQVFQSFDCIFVNTIWFCRLFCKYQGHVPVVWWLHDSEMIYESLYEQMLQGISAYKVSVFVAGRLAEEAFIKRLPAWKEAICGNLFYCRHDFYVEKNFCFEKRKLVFTIMGSFSKIKAHDVFLTAIQLLPVDIRKQGLFVFVGAEDDVIAPYLHEQADKYPEISIKGWLTQAEVRKVYQQTDVFVCPSRSDTMPIVVTEAMMCHIPCIVSDEVGQADFIETGVNGWIVPAGDAKALAKQIEDIVTEPKDILGMGDRARQIYEEFFSYPVFTKKINSILTNVLSKN